jgi:hypothetical protein
MEVRCLAVDDDQEMRRAEASYFKYLQRCALTHRAGRALVAAEL